MKIFRSAHGSKFGLFRLSEKKGTFAPISKQLEKVFEKSFEVSKKFREFFKFNGTIPTVSK